MHLVFDSNAAVSVHGDHLIQILAGLTEPPEVGGVEEADLQPDSGDKGVELDHVEHVLVVFAREILAAVVPVVVELDGPCVGFHVVEPSVGGVAHVRVVGPVVVARDLEIPVGVESREWIPQPHYICILIFHKYEIQFHSFQSSIVSRKELNLTQSWCIYIPISQIFILF